MDTLSWITICLVGVCYGLNTWDLPSSNLLSLVDPSMDWEWMMFKKTYNRTYKDTDEEIRRRLYYEDAKKFVTEHNKKYARGEVCYNVSLNGFADIADDEFQNMYMNEMLSAEGPNDYLEYLPESGADVSIPSSLDLRDKDSEWVSPVKNQERYCNSCWAFAATGALESMHYKYTGKKVNLSEQFLIDCVYSKKGVNGTKIGCKSGNPQDAFTYIYRDSEGIVSEACYPYEANKTEGNCKSFNSSCKVANDRGSRKVLKKVTELEKALVQKGPITITMNGTYLGFRFYQAGVYHEPNCTKNATHAMLVVGYGKFTGKCGIDSYWIIKNSYGTSWGEKGYVRMVKDDNDECGVLENPVYPVL